MELLIVIAAILTILGAQRSGGRAAKYWRATHIFSLSSGKKNGYSFNLQEIARVFYEPVDDHSQQLG